MKGHGQAAYRAFLLAVEQGLEVPECEFEGGPVCHGEFIVAEAFGDPAPYGKTAPYHALHVLFAFC